MTRYLFHSVLISFVFGVGVSLAWSLQFKSVYILLVVAVGLGVVWRRHNKTVSAPLVLIIVTTLLAFCLGIWRADYSAQSFGKSELKTQVGSDVTIEGVVIREPESKKSAKHLYLESGEDVILVTTNLYTEVAYGDKVTVSGKLNEPKSFTTDLGREFDYRHYLLVRDVEYIVPYAEVLVLSSDHGSNFFSALYRFKQSFVDSVSITLPEPQAGLGVGLLLGVKQALGTELEETFRTAGVVHIVVLSGYNIMLIISFTLFGLSFFLPQRKRLFVGLVTVVIFACLVGLSATVVRASIMAALFLVAQLLGRTYDLSRALLLAGAAMVFVNPYLLLYDMGFQFSFMATLGLILLAPRFEQVAADGVLPSLREYFFATLATQVAVLPLLLYHVGQVSLVALVTNVLVLPAVPIAMITTFLSGLVAFVFAPLAVPFAYLAYLSLSYIIVVATWCAAVPFAAINVSTFPLIFVPLLYAALAILWWYIRIRSRQSSTINNLKGWTIVEEIGEVGEARSASPTKDIPIFFR